MLFCQKTAEPSPLLQPRGTLDTLSAHSYSAAAAAAHAAPAWSASGPAGAGPAFGGGGGVGLAFSGGAAGSGTHELSTAGGGGQSGQGHGSGIARHDTIRIKCALAELLQERGPEYWEKFRDFLMGKCSRADFEQDTKWMSEIKGAVSLHNALVLGILHNAQKDVPPPSGPPSLIFAPMKASSNSPNGKRKADDQVSIREAKKRYRNREILSMESEQRGRLMALSVKRGVKDLLVVLSDASSSKFKPYPTTPFHPPAFNHPPVLPAVYDTMPRSCQEERDIPSKDAFAQRMKVLVAMEGLAGIQDDCIELMFESLDVMLKNTLGRIREKMRPISPPDTEMGGTTHRPAGAQEPTPSTVSSSIPSAFISSTGSVPQRPADAPTHKALTPAYDPSSPAASKPSFSSPPNAQPAPLRINGYTNGAAASYVNGATTNGVHVVSVAGNTEMESLAPNAASPPPGAPCTRPSTKPIPTPNPPASPRKAAAAGGPAHAPPSALAPTLHTATNHPHQTPHTASIPTTSAQTLPKQSARPPRPAAPIPGQYLPTTQSTPGAPAAAAGAPAVAAVDSRGTIITIGDVCFATDISPSLVTRSHGGIAIRERAVAELDDVVIEGPLWATQRGAGGLIRGKGRAR
ncbi:transcriptional regulator of RNA polII, SAGA, subunit-domain-containing protein [Blyttiomyces helicus]|uniref:Transcriptional regulator of RNA polII, SAGA, subunit-domain-containing protein n=1 Tax=Blyttiomyces helicus TaxID=388810 RepID=A0A4P9WEJ5_9FUNG|nr:transcriptional regulator of RNA polII, SAGA, subunit-domain-containing protein [Blyttiomyces helicus]|eukprot:RKO90822.1 transcriptional regulator of RNA polII, SAGA, subunit-domain-containing protein [Blyttiomyces helicus]